MASNKDVSILHVNSILSDINMPIMEDHMGEIQSSRIGDNDEVTMGNVTVRSNTKSPPFMMNTVDGAKESFARLTHMQNENRGSIQNLIEQ